MPPVTPHRQKARLTFQLPIRPPRSATRDSNSTGDAPGTPRIQPSAQAAVQAASRELDNILSAPHNAEAMPLPRAPEPISTPLSPLSTRLRTPPVTAATTTKRIVHPSAAQRAANVRKHFAEIRERREKRKWSSDEGNTGADDTASRQSKKAKRTVVDGNGKARDKSGNSIPSWDAGVEQGLPAHLKELAIREKPIGSGFDDDAEVTSQDYHA